MANYGTILEVTMEKVIFVLMFLVSGFLGPAWAAEEDCTSRQYWDSDLNECVDEDAADFDTSVGTTGTGGGGFAMPKR